MGPSADSLAPDRTPFAAAFRLQIEGRRVTGAEPRATAPNTSVAGKDNGEGGAAARPFPRAATLAAAATRGRTAEADER
jgi:hypothetical protein